MRAVSWFDLTDVTDLVALVDALDRGTAGTHTVAVNMVIPVNKAPERSTHA